MLDVTTRGPLTPLTVVYYVGIARQDSSTLEILEISPGLYAVEVSEVGGSLVSGSPRRGCSSALPRGPTKKSTLAQP